MGFNNAVVGGSGILKRKAIQSINYVLGSLGWTINADGSAEFNNLTVRGTFAGLTFILNSSGLFFYSGTPALGNLIMSWATSAGSDQFTNPYNSGLTIGAATATQINLAISAGAGLLQFLTNNPSFNGSAIFTVATPFGQWQLTGPSSTVAGHTDSITVQINSSSGTGTSSANANLIYTDVSAVAHFLMSWGFGGVSISAASSITGVHPGTGTLTASPALNNPAVGETWQTPSLLNNWQVGGPIPGGLRYCYNPINGGRIDIECDVFNNVLALPATSTIAQLAAPYLALVNGNQFRRNMPAMNNYNFANNSPSAAWGWYDGAGNIQCINYETHAEFAFQGYIPLT